MCFICQDTKEIFVKSPTFLNNSEPCPICNDLSLKELDRIIHCHKRNGTSIKSIKMTQKFLNEITSLIPIEKHEDPKIVHQSIILMGIVITIDNNIPKWEIDYEK